MKSFYAVNTKVKTGDAEQDAQNQSLVEYNAKLKYRVMKSMSSHHLDILDFITANNLSEGDCLACGTKNSWKEVWSNPNLMLLPGETPGPSTVSYLCEKCGQCKSNTDGDWAEFLSFKNRYA